MNPARLTDARVSEALRARLPERAQAGLRERVMQAAETTAQHRPWPALVGRAIAFLGPQDRAERIRTHGRAWVLVAAAILALLAASVIFVGNERPSVLVTQPTATATATPTAAASPTSAATPTAEVSPPADSQSLELTWTKVALDERSLQLPDPGSADRTTTRVAWLDGRFVLVDEDSGAVSTSIDGATWHALQPGDPDPGYFDLLMRSFASWQDDAVGWGSLHVSDVTGSDAEKPGPDVLRIVRPPAEPTLTTPFKGRVGTIGIGPLGLVAHVHSDLDFDAWVTSKLGKRWVEHMTSFSYKDGILRIKTNDGRSLKVVWADEGFQPGDVADRGFGWYSPDGEHWTAIPDFPTNVVEIVGVSDGFIARGDNGMWHSSDGLTWRNVGEADDPWDGVVLPWTGGALVTDGLSRFDVWTADGQSELPMAAEVRAASKQPNVAFGTGTLGLVTVLLGDREILVTRNGTDYSIQPMPAEMADDAGSARGAIVAVGDGSVVVLLWTGDRSSPVPILWRGTVRP